MTQGNVPPDLAEQTRYRFLSVTRKFQDKRGVWHGLEKSGWISKEEYEAAWHMWYAELKQAEEFIKDNEH